MRHAIVTALFAAGLLAGCSTEDEAIESAREQHAAGELDAALLTLDTVRQESPGSEADERARQLATSWLVEAADRSDDVNGQKLRLEQALDWTPESGAAQARLCRVYVRKQDWKRAQRCLDEELKAKRDVPKDVVDEVRAALSKHDETAGAAERKKWLDSPSPHHWKALIDKYPKSKEASEAKQKLERSKSLCGDTERFFSALKAELKRQRELSTGALAKAEKLPERDDRLMELERIGKVERDGARKLKKLVGDIDAHQLGSGEEPVRKQLRAAFYELADSASELGEGLEPRPMETPSSFEGAAKKAVAVWRKALEKRAKDVPAAIDAVREACAPDGGAPTKR